MAIDFISSAQIGQWLTVETDVIKTGSTLCFAQCLVNADGGYRAGQRHVPGGAEEDDVIPERASTANDSQSRHQNASR